MNNVITEEITLNPRLAGQALTLNHALSEVEGQ
jgi:hypothetical protein